MLIAKQRSCEILVENIIEKYQSTAQLRYIIRCFIGRENVDATLFNKFSNTINIYVRKIRNDYKSSGFNPVDFDIFFNIMGPISSLSWKAETTSLHPYRNYVL